MARYQLAVVDLDLVEADPVVKAGYEAAVVVRRTAHPEQLLAVTDEEAKRESSPIGDELVLAVGMRLLNNPSLLRADEKQQGVIWNYHLRRTGIRDSVAEPEGLKWLREQPDKGAVPTAPAPGGPKIGDEA